MNNPGIKTLGDYALSAAVTGEVITTATGATGVAQEYIDRLEGMVGATLQVNFAYGSSGTTCKVTIETSFDQGTTWVEVARYAFTTASAEKLVNLTNASVTTLYAPAALSDDTVKDGLLGERWRAKVTSTGTYAGPTTVAVRLMAR